MKEKIRNELHRLGVKPSDCLTVALSGGVDSMVLLDVLGALQSEFPFELRSAHVNHGLRGEESDRDEAFVRSECEKRRVPLEVLRISVPDLAKDRGMGTEEAAREARYDFLLKAAPKWVVTAHHADDQLETVLLNLIRGATLTGLCGIPEKRGRILRPMLRIPREEIERCAAERHIAYVTDSTNAREICSRNVLRLRVIPILREMNPSVAQTVCQNSVVLKKDARYLSDCAEQAWAGCIGENGLSSQKVAELPEAIAFRVLKRFLEEERILVTAGEIERLDKLCRAGRGRLTLPGGRTVEIAENGCLAFPKRGPKPVFHTEIRQLPRDDFEKNRKIHNLLLQNTLDCAKIDGSIEIRTRKPGDTLKIAGRGITKTLKKLFSEAKINTDLRDVLPVIADESGVIWVYGFGCDQRVCVQKDTKQVLLVESEKRKGSAGF